jgi:hypothetical protein
MKKHHFRVGQKVHLALGMFHRGKPIACRILQLLPFDGVNFQYRVRNIEEPFDRIADETQLSPTEAA